MNLTVFIAIFIFDLVSAIYIFLSSSFKILNITFIKSYNVL